MPGNATSREFAASHLVSNTELQAWLRELDDNIPTVFKGYGADAVPAENAGYVRRSLIAVFGLRETGGQSDVARD
jgi:hypothetical protein